MSMFLQEVDENESLLYYRVRSSLIAALKECIFEIKSKGLSKDLDFFDFDCHAEIHELPQNDIIGLKSFSSHFNDGIIEISSFLVCSTMNDLNGIRLSKMIGHIFSRFFANKAIKILKEDETQFAALDIKNGTEVMPMSKSDGRMVQFIDLSANVSKANRH